MPHNPIRVVVGPANYFSHPGSLNHLHDFFTDEQLSRAVWISRRTRHCSGANKTSASV